MGRIEYKKKLLEHASKKYGIKSHCLMDEVLLYLRYLQDYFKLSNDGKFKDDLETMYRKYRTIYAEDPSTWIKIKLTVPSTVAATIFYLASIISYEEDQHEFLNHSGYLSQIDIHLALGSHTPLKQWIKALKILRPDIDTKYITSQVLGNSSRMHSEPMEFKWEPMK